MKKILILILAALLLLIGCGGSKRSGSSTVPRPGPLPPTQSAEAPVVRPEPAVGLNVQPGSAAALLPEVQALGVKMVRVSWWEWTTPEDWAWLPAYREAGIDVLPLVYGPPERLRTLRWAFGEFPAVQVGNEPDGRPPGADSATFEEGRAVAMGLLSARKEAGTATIISPGLAWNSPGVGRFLDGMLSVPGAFDVLAIHTYGLHVWGEPLSRWEKVREAGWQGPIWVTEFGVANGEAVAMGRGPDSYQLENWRRALTEEESRFGYERLYGFQLTPDPQGWGLLRADGSRRPAAEWLAGYFMRR